MLAHMTIHNFAIVKSLTLDFQQGMTTITGETGAGKSIAIDALGLCLGDRADSSMIRAGEDKAEIVAIFQLQHNPTAIQWLAENQLDDDTKECILRRVITKEGRSRAYINGMPVPVAQQKALGQYLINIHGQHAHQLLMRHEHQLRLLDQFAGHDDLVDTMQTAYQSWRKLHDKLLVLEKNKTQAEAQKQLLEYQVNELNELELQEHEYIELEEEHKRLSNAGDIATNSQLALDALTESEDGHSAMQQIRAAQLQIQELSHFDSQFTCLLQMLEEANIQIQEASDELTRYMDKIEMNPQRVNYLDNRIALILQLARKHKVAPEALYVTHQALIAELDGLTYNNEQIEQLQYQLEEKKHACFQAAEALSHSRHQHARMLDKLICASMHELSMADGQFHIQLTRQVQSQPSAKGCDTIDFLVSTNKGQPLQSLGKVASGGELSRISLAIQVITAQKVDTPSLIFDEVDVGISGATATIVGKLLRRLGESTQVMCVTHLPQVAGCGHHQMFVTKTTEDGATTTSMILLDTAARVKELARLLGGSEITEHTLANARELLIAV